MIAWRDQGILLAARPFGETSVIVEVFSPEQGRHAGVVRGGASRKMSPILQPGAQVQADWKARLSEHLGSFTVELIRSRTAAVMADRLALAGLNAVCGLLTTVLPEREAHLTLYEKTEQLLDLLGQSEVWPLAYLRWEQAVLDDLGFALDLTQCVVTGSDENLAYISPKSGRAVSKDAAGEWADRMLPLHPVLAGEGTAEISDIVVALDVTGYFFETKLLATLGGVEMPGARQRFIDVLKRYGDA